ncbi:MAG: hypothetical protein WA581_07620, partial [Candidatus Acidiferrales bacterium]
IGEVAVVCERSATGRAADAAMEGWGLEISRMVPSSSKSRSSRNQGATGFFFFGMHPLNKSCSISVQKSGDVSKTAVLWGNSLEAQVGIEPNPVVDEM